jgi:hypothetical protein
MKVKEFDRRRGKVVDQFLVAIEAYLQEAILSLAEHRKNNGNTGSMDMSEIDTALRTIGQALGKTSLPAELRKGGEAAAVAPVDEQKADQVAELKNVSSLRLVR